MIRRAPFDFYLSPMLNATEIIGNNIVEKNEMGVGDGFIGPECSKSVGTDDYSDDLEKLLQGTSTDDFDSDSFYEKLYPNTATGYNKQLLNI